MNGIDGEKRGGYEGGRGAAEQEAEESECSEDACDREGDAGKVKGGRCETEACCQYAVSEHLEGAPGIVLVGEILVCEADVSGEEAAKWRVWFEGWVHDDLLVIVPDEAVFDAIAIDNEDKSDKTAGGKDDVQPG